MKGCCLFPKDRISTFSAKVFDMCSRKSLPRGRRDPLAVLFLFSLPFLLCFLFLLIPKEACARFAAGKNFSGVVRRVIDGDSLLVSRGGGVQEVRLYGIDAPEYDQPDAAATRRWLQQQLQGRRVLVQGFSRDRYGRLVAVVRHNGRVINRCLVEEGMVWVYTRYCRRSFCRRWKAAERRAKRRGRNIWRRPHPVPPWVWRHRRS